MSVFKVILAPFQASPLFDIKTSGKDITAISIENARGLLGGRIIYTFETEADAPLKLTIKKAQGDVLIELPRGFDVQSDVIANNDFLRRLPRVTVEQEENRVLLGYVASDTMNLHFVKIPEMVQVSFNLGE